MRKIVRPTTFFNGNNPLQCCLLGYSWKSTSLEMKKKKDFQTALKHNSMSYPVAVIWGDTLPLCCMLMFQHLDGLTVCAIIDIDIDIDMNKHAQNDQCH